MPCKGTNFSSNEQKKLTSDLGFSPNGRVQEGNIPHLTDSATANAMI